MKRLFCTRRTRAWKGYVNMRRLIEKAIVIPKSCLQNMRTCAEQPLRRQECHATTHRRAHAQHTGGPGQKQNMHVLIRTAATFTKRFWEKDSRSHIFTKWSADPEKSVDASYEMHNMKWWTNTGTTIIITSDFILKYETLTKISAFSDNFWGENSAKMLRSVNMSFLRQVTNFWDKNHRFHLRCARPTLNINFLLKNKSL